MLRLKVIAQEKSLIMIILARLYDAKVNNSALLLASLQTKGLYCSMEIYTNLAESLELGSFIMVFLSIYCCLKFTPTRSNFLETSTRIDYFLTELVAAGRCLLLYRFSL